MTPPTLEPSFQHFIGDLLLILAITGACIMSFALDIMFSFMVTLIVVFCVGLSLL